MESGERVLLRLQAQLNRRHTRQHAWDDAWQLLDEHIIDGDCQVFVCMCVCVCVCV